MLDKAHKTKKKNDLKYLLTSATSNSEVDYENLHYVLKTLFSTSGKYIKKRRPLRKTRITDLIFDEYKIVTEEYPFIESSNAMSTNTVIFCNVCPFASHCQKRIREKMWVMCEIPSYDDFLIMMLNKRTNIYKQLANDAQYLANMFIRAWRHHTINTPLANIDVESIIGNNNMMADITSFVEN